ncbi:MAG: acyltransferase family protein [Aureispira sp.]
MTPLTKETHIPIIESLRGWAASAVCFYHFIWGTVNYIEAPWVREISYWGQYGVTLFFVLSGIVLPLALLKNGYKLRFFTAFLWRRCWRLEPPYFISLLVSIIYLALQAWWHQETLALSAWNMLLHLGYLIPFFSQEHWLNPVYWSLAVEFQYYCLLGIIFPLWLSPRLTVRWGSYILILGLSFVSNQKDLLFRWLPLFLISANYVLHIHRYVSRLEFITLLGIGVSCLSWNLPLAHSIVVLGTLFLVHFCTVFNPKWSAWLGRCSYSLYLLHLPIGQTLVNMLSHHYRLPYQKVLVLLLGYGSSVLAAAFFYHCVEKISQQKASTIVYGINDVVREKT